MTHHTDPAHPDAPDAAPATDRETTARVVILHGELAEVAPCAGAPDAPPGMRSGDAPGGDHVTVRLSPTLDVTPVAGDWVGVAGGAIVAVRPRTTTLTRPDPSSRGLQVLAANIDVVLLVLPIDRGLNARALELLSVMAWESGATPVVVLTKSDAAADPDAAVDEATRTAPGMEVLLTSARTGEGMDHLRGLLGPGVTATMLGASGAGKTSLLNALEGRAEATRDVRRDGEGRHTTTTRRLYRLAGGGVLLDVPGIRSLNLCAGEDAVNETFADIAAASDTCRFADCSHEHEPDCAVQLAVAEGVIAPRRLDSWRKVQRELAYRQRRLDPAAMAAERAKWKAITQEGRRRGREKRGG